MVSDCLVGYEGLLLLFRILYVKDLYYHIFAHPTPWKRCNVLLVAELYEFATGSFKYRGQTVIRYAELELIALNGSGSRCLEACLYQLAFPGLENIAFPDKVVEVPGLYTLSKYKVMTPPEDNRSGNQQYNNSYCYKFFIFVSIKLYLKSAVCNQQPVVTY